MTHGERVAVEFVIKTAEDVMRFRRRPHGQGRLNSPSARRQFFSATNNQPRP
jgi:hypothetical protein